MVGRGQSQATGLKMTVRYVDPVIRAVEKVDADFNEWIVEELGPGYYGSVFLYTLAQTNPDAELRFTIWKKGRRDAVDQKVASFDLGLDTIGNPDPPDDAAVDPHNQSDIDEYAADVIEQDGMEYWQFLEDDVARLKAAKRR